jgi:uncharacterized cupredoxin-like copper-binding protein
MLLKKILPAVLAMLLSACAGNLQPVAEVSITMNEFTFSPPSITIQAGQPIVITLQNDGEQEHDFVVKTIDVSSVSTDGSGVGGHHMSGDHADYDLHISTMAGRTSVLKFTADKTGTYKIFCSVEGHEVAGMVGELIVVEKQ